LDAAERLFQKSLESEPEAFDKAWVLVYLGRLSVAAGERDRAMGISRALFSWKARPKRRDRKRSRAWNLPRNSKEPERSFTHETNDSHRHPGNRHRCYMPDGSGPACGTEGPAPKSKGEVEALQALQAAGGDPDKSIAAAENLITKFADTDFKSIALYIEADAYQRKGDWDKI